MRRAFFVTSVLVASVLLAAGCAEARSGRLTVFASASLADAMQGVVTGFERAHPGLAVELHCAGTPHLLMQAHQGAAVDVFAAADRASMERFARSIALASPPSVLARNALTIVVAAGNPHRIAGLADLQRTGLLVALCGPRVPAGAYARAACARAGVELHSRSDEPSVKAVVTKVRLGEFDAGIVYATDLLGVAGVEAVPIRPEQNVEVELCIAASANGRGRLAADFVAFALADAGRRALAASGFVLP